MDVPIRLNVWPGVSFKTTKVTLGRDVMVNSGTRFDNRARVTLGDNVAVGSDVLFLTDSHEIGSASRRNDGPDVLLPITIGEGAWIGARVTVMPGIKIGSGAVVAAGAMVTGDCQPNGLYAGIPAKEIRILPI
jgi:maltose O-acetyltransferase